MSRLAPVRVDPEVLYRAATRIAAGQADIHDGCCLLTGRLQPTAGMAAGQHAACFAEAYDQAVAAVLNALRSVVDALGLMSHCLTATANNLVLADHSSHATTPHAHPDTRSLHDTVAAPRYRMPLTAGGPGLPRIPALEDAAYAWRKLTEALTEAGGMMNVSLWPLYGDAHGPELDAVHHHWSTLWRGPDHERSLLSAAAVACGRLGSACLDVAAAMAEDLGDPGSSAVSAAALPAAGLLRDLPSLLRRAVDRVPQLRVHQAETRPCPRVPETGPLPAAAWSPPRRRAPVSAVGLDRQQVARLTGGRVSGGVPAHVDVIGADGEFVLVADSPRVLGAKELEAALHGLREAAGRWEVPALAYFPHGTGPDTLALARAVLGERGVRLFG
ncbi:WXG100 family type VII secretion target [Peterkaempfera bronchialis]|uniref:WXG100 family type VII secretion target n=1 Tax=Peterkaempfera bronchialis TaxID=2126346 RepID=UPI0013B45B09|nr:WXG100 family type VII secretion target [Peterkaempfera bronchialis]